MQYLRRSWSRPSLFPSLLFAIAVIFAGGTSSADSLRGVLALPPHFATPAAVGAPVFWRLANPYIPIGPPIVDPRQEMVVALEGPAQVSQTDRVSTIELVNLRAEPPVIAVAPGTKVRFVNHDTMMHLIEPAPGSPFMKPNSVAAGDEFSQSFDKLGSYDLRCSEIPHLRATVLVTEQKLVALPDNEGTFHFADLPQDKFLLRVWYKGKWIHSQTVRVRGKANIEVRLPATVDER